MTKFVVYRDIAGQYRWRLIASNGEKVAASEAYTTPYSAKRSAERVKQIAFLAIIVDNTN
jgi:uncharacterized protein